MVAGADALLVATAPRSGETGRCPCPPRGSQGDPVTRRDDVDSAKRDGRTVVRLCAGQRSIEVPAGFDGSTALSYDAWWRRSSRADVWRRSPVPRRRRDGATDMRKSIRRARTRDAGRTRQSSTSVAVRVVCWRFAGQSSCRRRRTLPAAALSPRSRCVPRCSSSR